MQKQTASAWRFVVVLLSNTTAWERGPNSLDAAFRAIHPNREDYGRHVKCLLFTSQKRRCTVRRPLYLPWRRGSG